jgi:hypothetical protein
MDGNFNWEQMKSSDAQRRNDVPLYNGEGFHVETSRFAAHSRARAHDKPPVSHMQSSRIPMSNKA